MEPATLYLACLIATFGVWVLGERAWAVASWLGTRSGARSWAGRPASVAVGLLIAASLWRVAPAHADVVPPKERVMAATEPIDLGNAVTRYSIAMSATAVSTAVLPNMSTHTVVRGDCLWKIARTTLISEGVLPTGDAIGHLWRQIYAENRDTIGPNPNLIFPGQVLVIPER